ncbi:hypothetical protein GCM10023082_43410 [Streptomyces tremellae]|uniref:Transposase n=1 Tax=Streptomyces tremellae TaxID=1124239 RepID=A0ABP7FL44_9ACTN
MDGVCGALHQRKQPRVGVARVFPDERGEFTPELRREGRRRTQGEFQLVGRDPIHTPPPPVRTVQMPPTGPVTSGLPAG